MEILQIDLKWFLEQGGGFDCYYYDCVKQLLQVRIEVKGLARVWIERHEIHKE